MSEEEKEAINKILKEQIDSYEKYYVGSEEILPNISEDYRMSKIILNYIDKLQNKLDKEKEKNKKLNLENQALYESINCNDDNMLSRRYQKLIAENKELKEKIREYEKELEKE